MVMMVVAVAMSVGASMDWFGRGGGYRQRGWVWATVEVVV